MSLVKKRASMFEVEIQKAQENEKLQGKLSPKPWARKSMFAGKNVKEEKEEEKNETGMDDNVLRDIPEAEPSGTMRPRASLDVRGTAFSNLVEMFAAKSKVEEEAKKVEEAPKKKYSNFPLLRQWQKHKDEVAEKKADQAAAKEAAVKEAAAKEAAVKEAAAKEAAVKEAAAKEAAVKEAAAKEAAVKEAAAKEAAVKEAAAREAAVREAAAKEAAVKEAAAREAAVREAAAKEAALREAAAKEAALREAAAKEAALREAAAKEAAVREAAVKEAAAKEAAVKEAAAKEASTKDSSAKSVSLESEVRQGVPRQTSSKIQSLASAFSVPLAPGVPSRPSWKKPIPSAPLSTPKQVQKTESAPEASLAPVPVLVLEEPPSPQLPDQGSSIFSRSLDSPELVHPSLDRPLIRRTSQKGKTSLRQSFRSDESPIQRISLDILKEAPKPSTNLQRQISIESLPQEHDSSSEDADNEIDSEPTFPTV